MFYIRLAIREVTRINRTHIKRVAVRDQCAQQTICAKGRAVTLTLVWSFDEFTYL